MTLFRLTWTVALLMAAAVPASQAQEAGLAGSAAAPYVVPRLDGPIDLDGRVDEAAWEAIEPLESTTHFPTFGAPPTERTEFRLGYDDEYVYFSCRAYDSEPEAIVAFTFERDESGFRSDFCAIYIDTLNDEENALQFRTGPNGNRSDSQRMNDGEQTDNSWNTFWDVEVSRDEEGWYTEIRIPFSSLLYQSVDGRVVMGVSMLRNISRKNERLSHPAIPPDLGRFAYAKPSVMRKIVFEGVEPAGMPIYVTPYALGGSGYTHDLDVSGEGYERITDDVREGGLDARFGLTSNLTLDVTANTDFAQVEADDQQVNLTRFSLFFPEKRRFFQERSSNFEYGLGGQDRLFHSRTIGLVNGQPVRIYGGARLVGRVGEWDVGFLDLQTADSDAAPSENLGVARLRRRVFNANSYVGGIVTSRLGSGGHRNVVYGADAIVRVVGDDYMVVNWSQSFDGEEASPAAGVRGIFDRALVRLNWERRGQDGLTYAFDVTRAGSIFDPGMGFLRRTDFTRGEARLTHGWRSSPGARLYAYRVGLGGSVLRRNADGRVETVELEPAATLQTWGQHELTLTLPFSYEDLDTSFPLPEGTSVPAGTHRFAAARLRYAAPQGDRFRLLATVEGGQFFDGRRASVTVGPIWAPSAHLNLTAGYQLDHVRFPDRDQRFTAHLARFRAQIMLSTSLSAVGFVQYVSTDHAVVANARLRYNPREGNDFYLVWNEGLVTERSTFDPIRPLSDQRTIVVKYSHTFRLGS